MKPVSIAIVTATAALLLAACCASSRAEEPSAEERARALVEEALRRSGAGGPDSLAGWTRSVIDRALERAGRAAPVTGETGTHASPAPLPAERHAAGLGQSRPNTAETLVFMSLAVPEAAWRQWARDAAATGAPLVLRGVGAGGLRAFVKRVGDRLGGAQAGVAIDPRLFRLFGIERVPAVVVAPGGVPPCASRGCAEAPAPPHDRIAGNIGLAAALEAVADEGSVGRDVARRHLERMRGGERP